MRSDSWGNGGTVAVSGFDVDGCEGMNINQAYMDIEENDFGGQGGGSYLTCQLVLSHLNIVQ